MKNFLLWIWQLPQHLLGLIIIKVTKAVKTNSFFQPVEACVYCSSGKNFGVSLGRYIILGDIDHLPTTEHHELGHSVQSGYLGPLYLLIVGIPSALGNLWDRFFHKKWSSKDRNIWYYGRWPESWADELGGVDRAGLIGRIVN